MDNGLIKKITEQYLVDSMSFTECEARVLKEQGEGVREVTCQSISRSPIKEVVMYGDTDQWHKVKVQYSLMDEETEKEKKVTTYLLVNANDPKEAYERTKEHLKTMLVPFRIPKVEESPICEVFQYEKQTPKGFVKVDPIEVHLPNVKEDLGALTLDAAMDGDSLSAIDPTDGQAVAFEMDLSMYLQKIRPEITLHQIEGIREAYVLSDESFIKLMIQHGFLEDQAERISDILANEAAFEQDEEDNETDLESRFDAAMKGGGND